LSQSAKRLVFSFSSLQLGHGNLLKLSWKPTTYKRGLLEINHLRKLWTAPVPLAAFNLQPSTFNPYGRLFPAFPYFKEQKMRQGA
jgi:hypothetical protein